MSIVDSVVQSTLIVWVAESDWGYPIVLTAHAIGMALVVGIVFMMCLRVLGVAASIPLRGLQQLYPVLLLGAVINVCSGTLLFLANYTTYIENVAFLTKIGLLISGGIAAWLLATEVNRHDEQAPDRNEVTVRAKVIAAISLVLWLGAIGAGRIIAYTSFG